MLDRYHRSVAWLNSTINRSSSYMEPQKPLEFFLERTLRLLERLDHPERGFRVIHVAGSSGKGSTSAMLASVLHAAGRSVGLYTSPYVSAPVENIQLNGQLIDADSFAKAVEVVRPVVEHIEQSDAEWMPSYSEIFMAAAFLYFQREKPEWIVLETGCGGRFDKTNVVPDTEVCVITNISLEHTDLLGNTTPNIAWHKAGIIKPRAAVFSAETDPEVRAVFDSEAAAAGTSVQYIQPTEAYNAAMVGAHQQWNANLVAAVSRSLGVSDPDIRSGIATVRLPARVELMQEQPRVILDGAHSPAKIQALVESLNQFRPWNRMRLVFTAKESKSVEELLTPLLTLADTLISTGFQLPGFGSHNPQEVAETAQRLKPELTVAVEPHARTAVERALAQAGPDDLVLLTGSLYGAGEMRLHWISEEEIVRRRSPFI